MDALAMIDLLDGPPTIEWTEERDGLWERRTETLAVLECEGCGGDVALEAETSGWILRDDGRWHHELYGPAMGVCCGRLYADWWEGTFVYRPGEPA